MKLSLAWVLDHIEKPHGPVDVADIVNLFNESTAEIEKWSLVKPDLSSLALAQITLINEKSVEVYIPEHALSAQLHPRFDIQDGYYVFVRHSADGVTWARMSDLGSTKDALLPLVYAHEGINPRNWRQSIEQEDYLLEIDNKSITHRPDMWSHRGFARELAVIKHRDGWRLKPLEAMLAPVEIEEFLGTASPINKAMPTLTLHDKAACRRLASAFVSTIAWSPSRLPMMARLCLVDSRPIDAIVDITNYVMFDIGQPMHVFDAAYVRDHQLSARKARTGETLRLIDGETIALTPHDLILTDSAQPISLAGIMGGSSSAVKPETITLLLESGSFDPSTIRHSVGRHKKRTEASLRFEKNLDPNQVIDALRRYLYLLDEQDVAHTHDATIVVVGAKATPLHIEVSHSFLESRLGTPIEKSFVINTLIALGFNVSLHETTDEVFYAITVPSYRATKDIRIKEDIVEEIGRFWGYKNIALQIPMRPAMPIDSSWVYNQRMLKQTLRLSLHMYEIYSYAFFDEAWLQQLQWEPENSIEAQHPVSLNAKRLVTTLIPNVLKAVYDNSDHQGSLRFFEFARVWKKSNPIIESLALAGIMYDVHETHAHHLNKTDPTDFYGYQEELEQFFASIDLPVTWQRVDNPVYPWFAAHQTAHIFHGTTLIGTFGMIDTTWCTLVTPHGCSAHIAAFELDGTFLRNYKKPRAHYTPLPKYPDIVRALSLWIPLRITADEIRTTIAAVDTRIIDITLIDVFSTSERPDKKSLTFSFVIRDEHKTLTGQDADVLFNAVAEKIRHLGGEIR
jgi:phenylalanyl-tRNA synthetase beta chain